MKIFSINQIASQPIKPKLSVDNNFYATSPAAAVKSQIGCDSVSFKGSIPPEITKITGKTVRDIIENSPRLKNIQTKLVKMADEIEGFKQHAADIASKKPDSKRLPRLAEKIGLYETAYNQRLKVWNHSLSKTAIGEVLPELIKQTDDPYLKMCAEAFASMKKHADKDIFTPSAGNVSQAKVNDYFGKVFASIETSKKTYPKIIQKARELGFREFADELESLMANPKYISSP